MQPALGESDKSGGIPVDPLITAAARALARGDPLDALNHVALRGDAPALALRGIAMAQLGDLDRAKVLLRAAARGFGSREAAARARCTVALAEIALASRDLRWPAGPLDAARALLEARGDRANAAHARLLAIRRLVLIGRLDEAESRLLEIEPASLPPAAATIHQLLVAGIAVRSTRARAARQALDRAARSARSAGIPALSAQVESARAALDTPAIRVLTVGGEHLARLQEVEGILASSTLVVDSCRFVVHRARETVRLVRRPVLFGLVLALAEAWPGDASREELLRRGMGARFTDLSHRARLRVEIGRLRRALGPLAGVRATPEGFVLLPRRGSEVVVLAPPSEEPHQALLALLADGESWSSSGLALAMAVSQRTVQRALDQLLASGKVQAVGAGRARRWVTLPAPGFSPPLLLPGPLPGV